MADVGDAGDESRVLQTLESLVEQIACPEVLLVLAAHGALEINAPGRRARIEADRAKGNLDLEDPANLTPADLRIPDGVPVAVASCRAEQLIGHQSRGVHLEEVPVLLVEEWIHHPHEAIVGSQELVSLHGVAEQEAGLGVETNYAHVEGSAVERDPDFGPLGGSAPEYWLLLNEIARGHGTLPDRLVEDPIEHDPLAVVHPRGRHRAASGVGNCGSLARRVTEGLRFLAPSRTDVGGIDRDHS